MLICHIFLESEKSNREKYRFQATVIFIPQLSQYSNVAVPTKKKRNPIIVWNYHIRTSSLWNIYGLKMRYITFFSFNNN